MQRAALTLLAVALAGCASLLGADFDHAQGAAPLADGGGDGATSAASDDGSAPQDGDAGATDAAPGDAARAPGKLLLFGGYDETTTLADTWEWDGARWTKLAATLGARAPTLVVLNGRTLLYDANAGTTFAWSGGAFQQLDVKGPRDTSNLVTAAGGMLVELGVASTDAGSVSTTWTWNGVDGAWAQQTQPTPMPPARGGGAIAATTFDALVQGGNTLDTSELPLDDTWQFSGGAWAQVAHGLPRAAHAMAALKGTIYLFGGYTDVPGEMSSDTYAWKNGKWTKLTIAGPTARAGHAMAAYGGKLVMFGGTDAGGKYLNDTWEFDGAAWAQRTVSGPPARQGATMVAEAQ